MKRLKDEDARRLLATMSATGADFAEVFNENTHLSTIEAVDGVVRATRSRHVSGTALRILEGFKESRIATSSQDYPTLSRHARALAAGKIPAREARPLAMARPAGRHKTIKAERSLEDFTSAEKLAVIREATNAVQEAAKELKATALSTVTVMLTADTHEILIANTDGVLEHEIRPYLRLCVSAAAGTSDDRQTLMHDIGGAQGPELFAGIDWRTFAHDLVSSLMTIHAAPEMNGGVYDVVIGPGFGGVILHEACVHGLEATALVGHATVFEGKIGQRIANPCVSAVDDGTIPSSWGSFNVDDEGHAPARNLLIDHGILKSYLIDHRGAVRLGFPETGSGRRQDYTYPVTSRMSNTFFLPGEETLSSLVAGIKLGFYAKTMGGGSVDPATSEFNFAVREGYMIRDGKIAEARRGATLVGRGADVLMAIDGIARDDLSLANGICGSLSGSIPTTVGEPSIRVRGMTVGGKEAA